MQTANEVTKEVKDRKSFLELQARVLLLENLVEELTKEVKGLKR
jgi:hypothetical protein